jgi:hypothetical protein
MTVKDAAWKNYVPGLSYEYIVTSFLLPMEKLFNKTPNLDLEGIISGDRGHVPYSLEEFHDLFAEQYEMVLTNGDSTQKAVVFHTTTSKRNRNVGWYHVYEYNRHPIADIPDPIQDPQHNAQVRRNQKPDCFWTGICTPLVDYFSMSIGHILVGKLVLKHFPNVLGSSYASLLKDEEIRMLHGKQISNSYTLEYLFPDYKQFRTFVRNCLKKTLKWHLFPFTTTSDVQDSFRLKCMHVICSQLQLECFEGGLDLTLVETIEASIVGRKLGNLLLVGCTAMNSNYILFLKGLHTFYLQWCAELCGLNPGWSTQAATKELRKQWFDKAYLLPESL